jgi:hypothetical protein
MQSCIQLMVEREVNKMATKKKILTSNLQAVADVAANHEPGQALSEDQAERAASGSGYQGEEITDAELEKQQKARKPKLQIVRKNVQGQEVQETEKPAEMKRPAKKQPKPKVEKPVSKRETGVSRVNAQAVLTIFELAKAGKSNAEIAAATSIPQSYIGPILVCHAHWVAVTKEGFAAIGQTYPEKFVRPKKATAQKAGE